MKYIKQIEEKLDKYIKELELTGPRTIKLILNRTFIDKNIAIGSHPVCLHLVTKYKGLNWPELCVDEGDDIVLFIGKRY